MAKEIGRPGPHPDDFMIVTLSLEFRAKLNPKATDPPPLDTTIAVEETLSAANAADHLEKVVSAIRERRLYGFMVQDAAETAVGADQWIEKTTEEMIAEARAHERTDDGCSE